MASAAKNHTIQINSSQCDKMSGEHYRMRLTPPIEVPYLAEPRVMLEQLAFTNAFVNVDSSSSPVDVVVDLRRSCITARLYACRMSSISMDSLYTDVPARRTAKGASR